MVRGRCFNTWGHIRLFSASKQMGDILIVAIDDDESVKNLKGSARPVIRAEERVRILSALDSVDYVVVFSSNELEKLIEIIQPDVLTKGSNFAASEVFGLEQVEALGGRVVLIPVTENISSTRIINTIKRKHIYFYKNFQIGDGSRITIDGKKLLAALKDKENGRQKAHGYVIWSLGEDGKNDYGAGDDVNSWE